MQPLHNSWTRRKCKGIRWAGLLVPSSWTRNTPLAGFSCKEFTTTLHLCVIEHNHGIIGTLLRTNQDWITLRKYGLIPIFTMDTFNYTNRIGRKMLGYYLILNSKLAYLHLEIYWNSYSFKIKWNFDYILNLTFHPQPLWWMRPQSTNHLITEVIALQCTE